MIRYYAIYEVPMCSFLRFPSTFVQTRLKNQNSQTLRPSDFRTYSSSSPPNLNVLKPERHGNASVHKSSDEYKQIIQFSSIGFGYPIEFNQASH